MFNISVNFKDTKKGWPHFEKPILDVQSFFYALLGHSLNIGNQRLRSSHLSIPMFIGTPCNNRRIVWRRFYLKLGLEQRFGVLNSGSLFSSPPLGGDSRSNLLGLLNPEWKVRGESPRFTQDWRRVRERGVPFPPGVLSTLWEYKGVQFRIF